MDESQELTDLASIPNGGEGTGSCSLGVAIVSFQSEDVIEACLDSLLESKADIAKVVITENASRDRSAEVIREWAKKQARLLDFEEGEVGKLGHSDSWLTLLHAPANGGFAYATNRSLEVLMADPAITLFWLVNPDCRVARDAAARYIEAGSIQDFSLMGGRTIFENHRDTVQTDGGRVSRWTGVCESVNLGVKITASTFPSAASLDFITGANCVASRAFLETTGLMEEDYFLYYEEVDWALRRGKLPLKVVPEAIVWHHGGTSIGTGSVGRRPSAFANYFNYRNRVRFMRRFSPMGLPVTFLFALAKAVQLVLLGASGEARAVLAGLFSLRPPREVSDALSPEAREFAFPRIKSWT